MSELQHKLSGADVTSFLSCLYPFLQRRAFRGHCNLQQLVLIVHFIANSDERCRCAADFNPLKRGTFIVDIAK